MPGADQLRVYVVLAKILQSEQASQQQNSYQSND